MIVVADTSPINYLILLGHIEVLPHLYGRLLIPEKVAAELGSYKASAQVRSWISDPPEWLEIVACPPEDDFSMAHLDPGEREAIVLSCRVHADYLIVDDAAARVEALRRNISVTGTLGVLARASLNDLLDLSTALAALQKTTFFVAPELIQRLLEEDSLRKKTGK